MSSYNTILSSVVSEKRWVVEMCRTFPREHIVDVDFDIPPSVFRVPKTLSETKPEAYAPQQVGMGPYHHLRPDFYKTQRNKVAVIMKFLNAEQLKNFQIVVEAFSSLEYFIRACYDKYLDLDPTTLAWIMAIDAVFLLYFLKSRFQPGIAELKGDILMLENQIPVVFLGEARKILKLFSGDGDDYELLEHIRDFCNEVSPLKLNEQPINVMKQEHPLDLMYNLIVTNRGIKFQPEFKKAGKCRMEMTTVFEDITKGAGIAAQLGIPGGETIQKHISFMQKVPWDRIFALFKTNDPDEQNTLVEEIDIPSVSQLNEKAGITFELKAGGIRDVEYKEEEKKFYLPVITLKSNSEVILRNLLAYEAAIAIPGSTLELAEYVDLMCGIVDSPKDVDILKKAKIIESDLADAEIACIFNGIKKSTGDNAEKTTKIEKAIEKVNKQYDSSAKVKALRFLKRHVYRSWKFLTVLSTVMVLLLLTLQAFCQIYGCSGRLFKPRISTGTNSF